MKRISLAAALAAFSMMIAVVPAQASTLTPVPYPHSHLTFCQRVSAQHNLRLMRICANRERARGIVAPGDPRAPHNPAPPEKPIRS